MRPRFFLACFFRLICYHLIDFCAANPTGKENESASDLTPAELRGQELIEWVRENGGHINRNVELRNEIRGDASTIFGIFANGTIREGDTVCAIPFEIIVKTDDEDEEGDCGTVWATADAMIEGVTPYGRYLRDQPKGYLPGMWSAEGQWMLSEMLGRLLPPFEFTELIPQRWLDECSRAKMHPMQLHARMLVTARADDQWMVPFYDMINHRNGKWQNTLHDHDKKFFKLVARRTIEANEQLYSSYNQCATCPGRMNWFGTSEMFNDYGFVESMPQRWVFPDVRVKFDLDEKDDGSGELEIDFYKPPSKRGVDFFKKALKRLDSFAKNKKDAKRAAAVPQKEWDTIWQYHKAMTVAFTLALEAVESSTVEVTEEVWEYRSKWEAIGDIDEEDNEQDDEEEEVEEVESVQGDEL